MGFKKTMMIVLAILLCAAAAACSAEKPVQQSAATEPDAASQPQPSADNTEPLPSDEGIVGTYEFEENIYVNPLSSFIAVKGDMPYYEITDDMLKIIDAKNGTTEEFAGESAPTDISKEDFEALFENEIVLEGSIPDISVYSLCKQSAVYKNSGVEYRVYQMDDQVWLAKLNGHIWSIYRLIKTASVGIIGGADGPTQIYVSPAE